VREVISISDEYFYHQQKVYCEQHGYDCLPTAPDSKLGFAISTQGSSPINGLRHPPEAGTSGWYVWCGEHLSDQPDFFSAIHASHLKKLCPEIIRLLGLPPGHRFLIAGDYVDIWYDSSLLDV
jgi:hypothetical protein